MLLSRLRRCLILQGIVAILALDDTMLSLGFTIRSVSRGSATRNLVRSLSNSLDDFMGDVDQMLAELTHEEESQTQRRGWCQMSWKNSTVPSSNTPTLGSSPVEEKVVRGRRVYIKRDDLLRLPGSQVSGNKARKMFSLNNIPVDQFPTCVVSYGGPQSNSMLALAAVVNYKNREVLQTTDAVATFDDDDDDDDDELYNPPLPQSSPIRFLYYTKKLPRFLSNQPSGNLFRAQTLGMELVELSHHEYQELFGGDWGGSPDAPLGLTPPLAGKSLWVPQGGAFRMALDGAKVLATELHSFWSTHGNDRPLSVVLPGGTCSTAALVHHALRDLQKKDDQEPLDIEVVVVPCLGDAAYARRQMMALNTQIGVPAEDIPSILAPAPEGLRNPSLDDDEDDDEDDDDDNDEDEPSRYYSFGEPNQALLKVFRMLKEDCDLGVDLIYGASAWAILLRHWNVTLSPDISFDPRNPIAGRELLYVHSGGLEGVNSQLLRYKYKGLVTMDDIQLPGKDRQR